MFGVRLAFRRSRAMVRETMAKARASSELRTLHQIADRLEPELAREFEAAIARLRDQVDVDGLIAAIQQGNDRRVDQLLQRSRLPTELQPSVDVMRQAIEAGAGAAAAQLSAALGGTLRFDVINPAAVQYARTQSARLVADVSAETRAGIVTAVTRAVGEGITPAETARAIRPLIGLTERQANAVINYRFGLLEEDVEPGQVATLAHRYAARLLRERSLLIARTEIVNASVGGQQQAWQQAIEHGLLKPAQWEQAWIITPGACSKICEPMDDQRVPIGGRFLTGDGRRISGPGAHPACRCGVGLKRKKP